MSKYTDMVMTNHEEPITKCGNYLIQTCFECKKKLELEEGSIIYGNEWYHRDCWPLVVKRKDICTSKI